MNIRSLGFASTLIIAAVAIACGGTGRRSGFDSDLDPTLSNDGGTGGFVPVDPGEGSECGINNLNEDPDKDYDGDGYPLKYDCNECNPSINNGAFDIPGNGIDDDCNGIVDDGEIDCDGSLNIASTDPFDGARAIGLCKQASKDGTEWGVIEAKWVMPDGHSLHKLEGVGVLPDFGVNVPQFGESMLALSSGVARGPGHPGFKSGKSQNKLYSSGTPAGYPKESPACPGVETGRAHDGAGLELKVRVPSNAASFSFQQFFFTHEYPEYVCSEFNDFFVVMLDPQPGDLPDGNIAFDQDGNPISVNNSLFQVCEAGTHEGIFFDCPLGRSLLQNTGFDLPGNGGGTGWLTTSAPVEPGSIITLRFAIWDSGDGNWDSTVLIDDFQWSVEEADSAVTKPSDPK